MKKIFYFGWGMTLFIFAIFSCYIYLIIDGLRQSSLIPIAIGAIALVTSLLVYILGYFLNK